MTGITVFDIETADKIVPWGQSPREFFRIGATRLTDAWVTDDFDEYRTSLKYLLDDGANIYSGHNISMFDAPALLRRDAGPWVRKLAKRRQWIDTFWLAPLADPAPWSYVNRDGKPMTIAGEPERMLKFYALDNLAHRYGFPGKVADLKELAKEFGGFGNIPTDEPRYRDYLRGDIQASRHLLTVLAPHLDDYAWREQRVAAIACQMHCNGFRLDAELAQSVVDAHAARNQRTLTRLAADYDVPLEDAKGRPRKKPLSTKVGKEALEAAFRDLMGTAIDPYEEEGYSVFERVWPRTPGGSWAWGGEVIMAAAKEHGDAEVQALARDVAEIQGTRTVFQTALDNVHEDGFCHPQIHMLQLTGRSSVTNPGLTVFGKHGGRHLERGIFIPDVLPDEVDDPLDAHVLFAVDLAQMDARAVAALSQDHAYLELFQPGRDSHVEGAQMIWGSKSSWGGVDYRQLFKKLGHGWNYGMGVPKLAREAGVELSVAEHFDAEMRARFPRLVAWKDEVREQGASLGYVLNGFGRRVSINPDRAFTQAPAGAGQSATRDILLQGALDLDSIDERVLEYLKAMVHDEFVLSVRRRDAVEVRDLVVRTLSGEWCPPGCDRPVPVVAEASHFADRWSGCYEKINN